MVFLILEVEIKQTFCQKSVSNAFRLEYLKKILEEPSKVKIPRYLFVIK